MTKKKKEGVFCGFDSSKGKQLFASLMLSQGQWLHLWSDIIYHTTRGEKTAKTENVAWQWIFSPIISRTSCDIKSCKILFGWICSGFVISFYPSVSETSVPATIQWRWIELKRTSTQQQQPRYSGWSTDVTANVFFLLFLKKKQLPRKLLTVRSVWFSRATGSLFLERHQGPEL